MFTHCQDCSVELTDQNRAFGSPREQAFGAAGKRDEKAAYCDQCWEYGVSVHPWEPVCKCGTALIQDKTNPFRIYCPLGCEKINLAAQC